MATARDGGREGRAAIPRRSSASSARRRRSRTTSPSCREEVRWFPAMVSNHVMDLIEKLRLELRHPVRADRLRQGAQVLRLQGPLARRRQARRVRHRRDLRPLQRDRLRRAVHEEAARARGGRRRPVQHLPDDERPGRDARGLRQRDHPAVRGRRRLARSTALSASRAQAHPAGSRPVGRRRSRTDSSDRLREACPALPVTSWTPCQDRTSVPAPGPGSRSVGDLRERSTRIVEGAAGLVPGSLRCEPRAAA